MSENVVVQRYAKALYRLADSDTNAAKKFLPGLEAAASLFDLEESASVLKSPIMPAAVKLDLIKYALTKADANETLAKFLITLIEAKRVGLIPGVYAGFKSLIDDADGIVNAQVISAVSLQDKELDEIAKELSSSFKKTVKVSLKVDKSILGGLVIKVGNSLIDLSLKTKLDSFANAAMES